MANAKCSINYYPMDIELSFSSAPFVRNDSAGGSCFVKPNYSQLVRSLTETWVSMLECLCYSSS